VTFISKVKDRLRAFLPPPVLKPYRALRASWRYVQYRGDKHYCNICNSHLAEWIYVGRMDHGNRVCPVCNSYGRHRFMAMVLRREMSRLRTSNWTLLHFAPELGLQRWIEQQMPAGATYVSADLNSREVDLNLDVQRLNLPSDSVDVILLSHVLEHVDDDALALREMHRVLVPGGMLVVQVPLGRKEVTDDEKLHTPALRRARYGKTDHVRLYGNDIEARFLNAGFEVATYRPDDERFREDFDRMALDIPPTSTMPYQSESKTFVCRKAV
jgi:SAM-dependent methyltransferase